MGTRLGDAEPGGSVHSITRTNSFLVVNIPSININSSGADDGCQFKEIIYIAGDDSSAVNVVYMEL